MSPKPTPQPSSVPDRQFRLAQGLAIIMLIAAPLFYLGLAYMMKLEGITTGFSVDLTVYLLLAVAVLEPSVYWLIERAQVASYRDNQARSKMTPARVYLTLTIIKLALVESIYVFGLVVYIVTATYHAMLYFYPIGIIWSFVHWPRRDGYERITQRLGAP